ncbi:MAG TPA: hypothetical protein PLH78_02180 [Planctomycetota bacterium]|nr:hypothetical protein [Planctomycetota bacterium]HQM59050.1 hypothetical protein [Planctomycetota bacterium]
MSALSDARRGSAAPNRGARKPYEKPAVGLVSLRPEEAVLAGCKAPGGYGSSSFSTCGQFGCVVLGS